MLGVSVRPVVFLPTHAKHLLYHPCIALADAVASHARRIAPLADRCNASRAVICAATGGALLAHSETGPESELMTSPCAVVVPATIGHKAD